MNGERILVVDDEEDILELVRVNLKPKGYQVQCTDSGAAALRAIGSELPDLIILDLMMPEVDGFEVCRQVRARSSSERRSEGVTPASAQRRRKKGTSAARRARACRRSSWSASMASGGLRHCPSKYSGGGSWARASAA